MWQVPRFLVLLCSVLPALAQATNFPVSANMDTGTSSGSPQYVWYERGFDRNVPNSGLPPAEISFQSQSHSNRVYIFSDYTKTNALLITTRSGQTTGALTFATPAAYSRLSFTASAAGGAVNLDTIVHHQDGSRQTNTVRVNDWYMSTNAVWISHGRFDIATAKFDTVRSNAWRIYAYDIVITNTASPVTRVAFVRKPNQFFGNAAIFGVSGSNDNGFAPITVIGFNQDIVIEASHPLEQLPNLVGQFSGGSLVGIPGEATEVRLQFWNNGSASSVPVNVSIYLRSPNQPLTPTHKLGEFILAALPPTGVQTNITYQLEIPSATTLGSYEVVLWIDPDSQVVEVNEADNQRAWPIVIGPNLGIPNLNGYIRTSTLRAEIVFSAEIANSGASTPETTAELWFAHGTTNETKLALIVLPEFWTQRRYDFETVALLPNVPPGTYPLTIRVDPHNLVLEASETDNERTINLEITEDHLQAMAILNIQSAPNAALSISGRSPIAAEVIGSTNLVDWYFIQVIPAASNFTFNRTGLGTTEFYQIRAATPNESGAFSE